MAQGAPRKFRVIGRRGQAWVVENLDTGGQHVLPSLALRVQDAAAALAISPRALTALITARGIPAWREGRSWRVSIDAVFDYIARREQAARDMDAEIKAVAALCDHVRGRRAFGHTG